MDSLREYFSVRKNVVNLLLLVIVILGLPILVLQAQQRQIFLTKASAPPITVQGLQKKTINNQEQFVTTSPQVQVSLALPSDFQSEAQANTGPSLADKAIDSLPISKVHACSEEDNYSDCPVNSGDTQNSDDNLTFNTPPAPEPPAPEEPPPPDYGYITPVEQQGPPPDQQPAPAPEQPTIPTELGSGVQNSNQSPAPPAPELTPYTPPTELGNGIQGSNQFSYPTELGSGNQDCTQTNTCASLPSDCINGGPNCPGYADTTAAPIPGAAVVTAGSAQDPIRSCKDNGICITVNNILVNRSGGLVDVNSDNCVAFPYADGCTPSTPGSCTDGYSYLCPDGQTQGCSHFDGSLTGCGGSAGVGGDTSSLLSSCTFDHCEQSATPGSKQALFKCGVGSYIDKDDDRCTTSAYSPGTDFTFDHCENCTTALYKNIHGGSYLDIPYGSCDTSAVCVPQNAANGTNVTTPGNCGSSYSQCKTNNGQAGVKYCYVGKQENGFCDSTGQVTCGDCIAQSDVTGTTFTTKGPSGAVPPGAPAGPATVPIGPRPVAAPSCTDGTATGECSENGNTGHYYCVGTKPSTSCTIEACANGGKAPACVAPPSPSPSPRPQVKFFYQVAESQAGLGGAAKHEFAGSVTANYPFVDKTPGTKFLFVRFSDDKGKTVDSTSDPIFLLGPNPTISGTACPVDVTGNGLAFTIQGTNFTSSQGSLQIDGADIPSGNITSWADGAITATLSNPKSTANGANYSITVTKQDGGKTSGSCVVGVSTLKASALYCTKSGQTIAKAIQNASLIVYDPVSKKETKDTIEIDKDGSIKGLKAGLNKNQTYKIGIKTPASILKVVDVPISGGTTLLNQPIPFGDLSGNGQVNAKSVAIMFTQWTLTPQVNKDLIADSNGDGVVNSLDYACLVKNYGLCDDADPATGQAPCQSVSSQVKGVATHNATVKR